MTMAANFLHKMIG